MTVFSDMLLSDLDNVFFNTGEFATVHNINGVDMKVIIDNDILKEILGTFKDPAGLYRCEKVFLVQAAVFGDLPAGQQKVMFDGIKYLVEIADDTAGDMFLIGLKRISS